MPLRSSLDELRKKKTELREDLRGTKEDLLSGRPHVLQNMVTRRVGRLRQTIDQGTLRKSLDSGRLVERIRKNLGSDK